jgi:hypothetical protein
MSFLVIVRGALLLGRGCELKSRTTGWHLFLTVDGREVRAVADREETFILRVLDAVSDAVIAQG